MNKITPRKTTTLTVDSESEFFPIFSRLNLRLFELSKINNELHLSIKKCLKYPLFSIERFFFWSKVKRSHFYLWILSVFPSRLTRAKTNSLYFSSLFFTIFWRNTVKSNVKCKSPVSGVLQYLHRNWKMIWKLIYYLSVHLSKREAADVPRNSFSIRKFCMICPFC